MNDLSLHPVGATRKRPESDCRALVPAQGPMILDTFGGRVHVEWHPPGGDHAARTVAVLHRVTKGWRPVRSLDRPVPGELDQPECAEQARCIAYGDVVNPVRLPALGPHQRGARRHR